MKELRRAALAIGVRLTGVLLEKEMGAIDRPMLVYVKRGPHGHYVVIRPVGATGTLAQVLDSTRPPIVMDKAELLASEEWTGVALIPQRVADRLHMFVLSLALAGLLAAGLGGWVFKSLKRATAPRLR